MKLVYICKAAPAREAKSSIFYNKKKVNMNNPFKPTGIEGLLGAYLKKVPQFEIYEDNKDPKAKFRWRITMSSDIVAASSQGYATRALALENVKKVRDHINELEKLGKLV